MKSLDVIHEEWALCTRCELHETRRRGAVVDGEGPSAPQFMLIYDMPSQDDMAVGAPMRSILDVQYLEVMEASGISREELFLLPLVGCSPLVKVEETQNSSATEVVRSPRAKEVEACIKRVHDTIYTVDPHLIFLAGEMSFKALVPGTYRIMDTTLAKAAGKIFTAVVPGKTRPLLYAAMPLPSPQDVYQNPSAASHGPIGIMSKAIEDVLKYVAYLETT